MFRFEDLKVYKFSQELAVDLTKESAKLPNIYARIKDQLIGAAISIPLNLAEGSGRLSKKDKVNFYKNSRSSLYEVYAILDICNNLKLINKEKYIDKIIIIAKMLTKLIQSQY